MEGGRGHLVSDAANENMSGLKRDRGVPGMVVAQLMRHANVDTTINVYTQVLDGSVRDAVERVGSQMNAIERSARSSADATRSETRIA